MCHTINGFCVAIMKVTLKSVIMNGSTNQGGRSCCWPALIARLMGPTWGPSGADRTQVGPMLAPWTCYLGDVHDIPMRPVLLKLLKRVGLVLVPNWVHVKNAIELPCVHVRDHQNVHIYKIMTSHGFTLYPCTLPLTPTPVHKLFNYLAYLIT